MALRCVVCNRPFKDLSALQKHRTAFGHNDPAVVKAFGETTFKDQSLTKSNPPNIAPSTTKKVKSSGSPDFHCGQCSRSFASQGALTTHAKAKAHSVANTANLKTQGKTVFRYNPGNQPHPLAIEHMYYSGLTTSFQEMVVSPKECATEAISQQSTLIKERGMDGVPPARSSMLINQASHMEDVLAQYSQTLQGPLNLTNVYGSTTHEQLKHLGKEWSTILLSEQPLTLKILRNLCHPASDLENNGYLLRQYTLTDLLGRQRCKGCKSTLCKFNLHIQAI